MRVGNFFGKCPNRVGKNAVQAANARRVANPETEKSASGVRYYGRRYYDPKDGRFVGRDPLQEAGGINLYAFVTNNAVNLWDYLGMTPPLNYHDGQFNGVMSSHVYNTGATQSGIPRASNC